MPVEDDVLTDDDTTATDAVATDASGDGADDCRQHVSADVAPGLFD